MTIITKIMDITPEIAGIWLAHNTHNRPFSKSRVNLYARDMKNGQWKLTHQGIAIDEHGAIGDGQHRLAAVVKSGQTVKMQVTTGLPREDVIAIDRGYSRTVTDAVAMSIEGAEWMTPKVAAATKWAFQFPSGHASAYTVYNQAQRLKKSLVFAVNSIAVKKTGIMRGPLVASVALMHAAGEDEYTLSDFCNKLVTGIVDGNKEGAVVRLREYLISTPPAGSQPANMEIMARTQRAFQLFRDKTPCKRLQAPDVLPYPRKKLAN